MITKREGFIRLLKNDRVIAATKNMRTLETALPSKCSIVFVLNGDLMSIAEVVAKIKQAKKYAFAPIDLIDGLSSRDVAVDYIATTTMADGVISTKPNIVGYC